MSSEILRKAAALIRERAEAATPVPWEMYADRCLRHPYDGTGDSGQILWDDSCEENPRGMADGEHIASWHPAVALAVADLLEAVAEAWPVSDPDYWASVRAEAIGHRQALDVALLYLGDADD